MSAPIYAPVEWRFAIVTPVGAKISMLTSIASNVELLYQLNRSTMLTFDVPSDDPRVNIQHTDGHPYLDIGRRWVLGWRKSPPTIAPYPGNWELKYAGRVWTLQDTGDGNTARTMVTCFDALKHLEKRIVRDAAGDFDKQVKFWATPGTQIIKTMIDRTQSVVGTCRIDTGGTWADTSPTTAAYDQANVMPSIIRITDTGTADLSVEYLDGSASGHNFLQLGGSGRLGTDKPGTILGYASWPRRATGFDRTLSLDNLANSITLYGKSSKGHKVTASDATSQGTYDVFEDVSVVPDVETSELLQMLAAEEVFLRANPTDLVSITPTPEDSPRFFNEYFLGDTLTIKAAEQPNPLTRDTVNGLQRVYGARLAVDEQYGESIKELVVSSNAETA